MHRVVPELIIENYRAGRFSGEFSAVGMFLDLSGFSTMTDTLMQYGQHGAEVLAGLMHGVFDPLVESIFEYGGKIVGFAGDGIMALYPIESDAKSTALQALTSADVIQKRFAENPTRQTVYGEFSISAKIGFGSGSAWWGILCSPNCDQATYYFRGTAVDESAHAEQHAKPGDILLTKSIYELLQDEIETVPFASHFCFRDFHVERPGPKPVSFPPVDLDIARLFIPEEVIANDVRGEFRQVVNLFVRFPDLSETQLDRLIHKVFELRNKYGGLLSRMDFGDKGCNMLVLWGAPVAYENDIGRALNFLLDLKSAVDFTITAGVTYYISHAGYLGSSLYEDYTCYGWGVNLASRFMMAAQPGEIWVDDRIARRVARRFELDFVGSQSFKGFASEQKVYLLRGYTQTLEPIYQGEVVGRKEELALLASFTEPLWQDRFAGLLLLSGEAGIGKGRLVHEFRASTRQKGKKALWAVCQSNQILRQSFNPLRSWLFRYFGISSNQLLEEQKQAFDAKLDDLLASLTDSELAQEIQRTRSILGALLNLHWDDSLHEQLDAEGRYNNTFLALIALLKAESLRQPVILVLEDFQFTDKDTQDFLPRLKRAILATGEAYPIAILVTTRPPGPGLAKDLIDARIDLRAISTEAIAHLIEISLGGAPAPDLVTLLVERSEGNPYFAEQILRYLQEENLIETSQAGWRLVREIEEAFLPGDIRSVLVARLDQLRRGVRESIQTASVLGREFEVSVLEHMLREDELLHQHIAEAEQAAVWNPSDDLHYVFSHGLLRDAAYEMQMQSRRRELHTLAVDALEHLYGNVKNRYAELAYHAKYAGLASKAQKYYFLAGKAAAESYQNHQAIEYYNRALAFTPLNDLSTQYDMLIGRVEIFNRVGNRASQLKDLDMLAILAGQLNDQQRLLNAKILHARFSFTTGNYPGTIQISEQVVEISKQLNQADHALGVYIVWSQALFRLGKLEAAQKYGMEGLELARRSGKRVEEGRSLSSLGLMAIESKEPGIAQRYLEEAVAIARETKERTLESRALANLANSAAFVQQDYATARTYYEQAYALNVELGDRYAQGLDLTNIGWVCGMLGDFATARTYHEQALMIAREVGNIYQETYTLMNLSRVAEVQGNAKDALKYANDAMDLSKQAGDKSAEAWSYLYLGHAHTSMNEFEKANIAFGQALNIRRDLGQSALATEPMAGLIQVALHMNDLSLAKGLMEKLLSYLFDGAPLDAIEEPLRVYLACYNVLELLEDPRSLQILNKAMELLKAQLLKINDEKARRMYIENVPWRRAIESAWLAKNRIT
jgi:predicted ATPase/class 3 adenylate cyclase